MRGPLIGTISVQDAYNKSIELVFDKNTNSALFTKLKDYFITRNRLTLITYVPTTRAMSGKFCVDYLSITAASIVVNWGFTPTTCVFNNGNSSVKAGTTVNMTLTPANSNYTHTIVWKFGSITESQKVAAGVKTATKAIP